MPLYKGIQIAENLSGLVRHMASVEEYRETLQNLQGVWDNLTLLGQLSGTGTDMTGTRQAFHQLTGNLLNNLGGETLKKTVLEMKSKAQVAVDIMIRNLFERTADIGFLATDDDLRDFLTLFADASASGGSGDGRLEAARDALRLRLREYVAKYSVYFNIILLDLAGNVVIQLDESNDVQSSSDPLIAASLATEQVYVETFRHSDLLPAEPVSLIYSYRVTTRDGATPLGVLCLCFRFHDETERIFGQLVERDDWSVIMLLDADGVVIASSEQHHIPVGAKVDRVLEADWRLVRFAGREYIATTQATKGYQGYMGPGWFGHVMVPVQHAFGKDASSLLRLVSPEVLARVLSNPSLFSESLRNIPLQAEQIQRELNRSVWNGNVRQSSDRKALNPAFSKVLLWEISNTGLKTKDVFERSIGNLHQTVVSSILQDSQFLASLAIDIMDRNLYERANDCRWWALTSEFRRRLAKNSLDDGDRAVIEGILAHINNLYTVYDNLVLFDRQGKVLAVSNPDYRGHVGRVIGADWMARVLSLKTTQDYAVSDFAPSPFYRDRHTYIYGAAIRALDADIVLGGIGIVFDARPQFEAMLCDALPRNADGKVREGCFGVFADRERRVIAATRRDILPGSVLDIDGKFFALDNGAGLSNIISFDGSYYAVGSRMSSGYREYKGEADAYRNDIAALIFVPLGEIGATAPTPAVAPPRSRLPAQARASEGDGVEIATFFVGEHWLGVRSQQVVEAIDAVGITSVPGAHSFLAGFVMFRGDPIAVVSLRELMQWRTRPNEGENQIVVIREDDEKECIGLLVDALGEIPEVPANRIEKINALIAGENMLAESLVKISDATDGLLVVLSPERIRVRMATYRGAAERLPGGRPPNGRPG